MHRGFMIKVTATKLRSHIFEYLQKTAKGETVAIQRNGVDVALLVPVKRKNWRDRMKTKPKLLMPAAKAFEPMEDIWEDYS